MKNLAAIIMLLFSAPALAQNRTGVVTGQIQKPNGLPAVRMRIFAIEIPDKNVNGAALVSLASITQSDKDGRYRLDDLHPGRYLIGAGPIDLATYYPGVKMTSNATPISIEAGALIAEVDFTVAAPTTVSGHVLGMNNPVATVPAQTRVVNGVRVDFGESSGRANTITLTNKASAATRQPVQGIQPVIVAIDGDPLSVINPAVMTGSNQELSAWIGADGSFLFPEVPPGTYAIRPQPFNEPFTVSLPEGKVIADPPTIVVGETDVSDVVVALYGRLAVRVVVDQGGPAPAFTMTFTENNGPPIQAFPSTAGLYEVTLPPTSYQVAVSDLAEGYSLKSVINGSVDLLRAPLVMNSASNLIVVTLGVSNPPPWVNVSGRLSGLERGDNGETLISLYSEKAGLEYKSILRRDGAFEFQRVVPGIYGVWIEPEPAGIPAIKITVPRRDLRVEITLPPRVPVSGKVAVDHGGTLPTSPVALTEIGRPPASGPVEIVPYRRNLPLEPDGSFSTVLPVGEYRAEPPRGGPFTARGFVDETSGKALADSITVTGSKSKDISIALSVATFPVKGRVRSTDSRLIEGLNAVLEGTGLIDAQNAPLNADGTVEFPNVPPGAYVIRINEGLPADFSVDGNGNQTLDFMMLRGKAIFPAGAPIPQLALTFLPNPSAQSRSLFAHPTIRADGSFEIVLPSADYRVAVAGYFANYALKMYRNGKAAERQDDLMFTISAQDDIELEATFLEPKP